MWGRRADGVEVGVIPFGSRHPVAAFRGRWHVQVRRPSDSQPLAVSEPLTYEQARVRARLVWRTWGIEGGATAAR